MSGSRLHGAGQEHVQVLFRRLWYEACRKVSEISGQNLALPKWILIQLRLEPSDPSRIYEILPQRIQQWQQSPCVAEEMGRRQLERIRREQQAARLRLTQMEKRFHDLEGIIATAKLQQVQEHEEVRDNLIFKLFPPFDPCVPDLSVPIPIFDSCFLVSL